MVTKGTSAASQGQKSRFIFLSLALCAIFVPMEAYATGGEEIAETFCMVVDIITGNLGKALASLAIITLGITAMFGRITWLQAIIVITGIAIIFGATAFIEELYGAPCPVVV